MIASARHAEAPSREETLSTSPSPSNEASVVVFVPLARALSFNRTQTERTGTFQIVVEAETPDEATQKCYERLHVLRETTKLFDEPVVIYSDGLVRLTGDFAGGVLVNFEVSYPDGGRISNLIPDTNEAGVTVFVPKEEPKGEVEPFVTFDIDDDDERGSGPSLTN